MSFDLIVPNASAGPVALADFLELRALQAADRNASIQDLVREIRRSGTVDAIGDPEAADYRGDAGSEKSESIAEAAFQEIENRFNDAGGEGGAYPYDVASSHIQLRKSGEGAVYTFQLLLSFSGAGSEANGKTATELFEEIAALAAASYFGGESQQGRSLVFGFPRRVLPVGFGAALDVVCQSLGEGDGHRSRPTSKNQKDAKLDIVSWCGFPDGQPGQLIGFGQCAAGANWRDKTSELDPTAFCKSWMRTMPAVDPVGMLFVPHRIDQHDWYPVAALGGVLFDRCRIAYHASGVDGDLKKRWSDWSKDMLKKLRKS